MLDRYYLGFYWTVDERQSFQLGGIFLNKNDANYRAESLSKAYDFPFCVIKMDEDIPLEDGIGINVEHNGKLWYDISMGASVETFFRDVLEIK